MQKILLAAILLVATASLGNAQHEGFLTTRPEPENYAWWLRTEFHPFEVQVRKIPAARIRSTWCKATEFRRDLFPPEFVSDIDESAGSFAVDGFFEGRRVKETALVGVYESCNGELGSFLLVLAWRANGAPVVRFVHEMPGENRLAILKTKPDSTIVIFYCLECDNFSRFKWDKVSKVFKRLPPPF